MKQAGKLESKSMVLFAPNPTSCFFVDRHAGEIVAVAFLVTLDESTAPVISTRCLFETFKQLDVIFARADVTLVVQ